MRIEFTCAMCGRGAVVEPVLDAKAANLTLREIVASHIKTDARPWYAQVNGGIFDIYCSKECSE